MNLCVVSSLKHDSALMFPANSYYYMKLKCMSQYGYLQENVDMFPDSKRMAVCEISGLIITGLDCSSETGVLTLQCGTGHWAHLGHTQC